MPQLTGKALAKELKRIRPDIPIILCIGYVLPMTPESRPLTASARISPSQSATRTSEPPFSECSALAPPAAANPERRLRSLARSLLLHTERLISVWTRDYLGYS